jgi:hypothetical protein
MSRSLSIKSKQSFHKGLRIDRITRIIAEHRPEIWQAAVDRQDQQIENRRVLILAARDHLRQKAS